VSSARAREIEDDDPTIQDAEYVEGADGGNGVDGARQILFKWIEGIARGPDVEQGFKISLLHAAGPRASSRDRPITWFRYSLEQDVKEIVDEIVGEADEYLRRFRANEIRFAVRIAIDARMPMRKAFTLRKPKTLAEDNAPPFEGPSDYMHDVEGQMGMMTDLVQFYARDNHQVHREARSDDRETIQELREQIRDKDKRIAELEFEREDIRDMQWARDDARRRAEGEDARKEMVFKGLVKGGKMLLGQMMGMGAPMDPAMMAAIAGAGPMGGENACSDELHHGIVGTIAEFFMAAKGEDIQKLMMSGIFPQDQLARIGKLYELFKTLRDRPAATNGEAR
jgi:hypothetical protein